MLTLKDLKPAKGSRKDGQRVGRGQGSKGKTAGRGNNGAKSRSGWSQKDYFEGGQLPLIRRLPKRGFTNIFKTVYQVVNIAELEGISESVIDKDVLFNNGKINSKDGLVKILGDGEIKSAVTVKADAFSKSAEAKITAAGGSIEVINRA